MPTPFSQYGVEIELMIVDRETLAPRAIADQILREKNGTIVNSLKKGDITWSNELVMHVLEFKTCRPTPTLDGLAEAMHRSIVEADGLLGGLGARMLGSAMHPWFDPTRDTQLWLHDDREIYDLFNRIFDCRGHGWSNLQSFHLNLPFDPADDVAFRRLHSAIRLVLPLIPALAASSPIVEGRRRETLDTRLETYWNNCQRIPSVTGGVIPEVFRTRAEYEAGVFDLIARDLAPHDPEGLLEPIWTNARGAIARFDRGSIEIRVGDVQECPRQDLAILQFIVHLVQSWYEAESASLEQQEKATTVALRALLKEVIVSGGATVVRDAALLGVYGQSAPTPIGAILRQLLPATASWRSAIELILEQGTLAERLRGAVGTGELNREILRATYTRVADCLRTNQPFVR